MRLMDLLKAVKKNNPKADFELIKKAHEYLLQCSTRPKLNNEYFTKSIKRSEVYNLIDPPMSSGKFVMNFILDKFKC